MQVMFNSLISAIALAAVVFLYWKMNKKFEEMEKKLSKLKVVINRVYFELSVQKMVESESLKSVEGMAKLGKKIFDILRRKYGLSDVMTYTEMKERIKEMEIDEEEKKAILEFLEDMIYLEYAPKVVSKSKKEEIRDRILKVFRMVGEFQ